MDFLFPFLTLLQPGILWPELADYRPMLVATVLGVLAGLMKRSDFRRGEAFGNVIFKLMCVFFVAQVVSMLRNGLSVALDEAVFWSTYLLYVVTVVLVVNSDRALHRHVWGMLVGGMVVVIYGIYGLYAWGGYKWYGEPTGRAGAYGMYENHNDYSFIIVQLIPFLFMMRSIEKNGFKRLLLGISVLACIFGMFLSLSRGGILALLLELFILVYMTTTGAKRAVLVPLVLVIGLGATVVQYTMRAENQAGGYSLEDSESSRFELWRAARLIFEDRPLTGVGSRRFFEWAPIYMPEMSHNQRGKNSHNTYLEVLAGSGLFGFIPFILLNITALRQLRRRPTIVGPPILEAVRIACLAALGSTMFRAILDAKEIDWSFYMVYAITLVWGALQARVEARSEEVSRSAAPVWAAASPTATMLRHGR